MSETTQVATTENQTLTAQIQDFKMMLAKGHQKSIENAFGDEDTAKKFLSAVANAVAKTPKLLECNQQSMVDAVMSCVACRIFPNTPTGEAYLIPYKGKVQFQLGYKGICTLLYRAGITGIWCEIVRENDEFDYELGLDPKLKHKPALSDRGKAIAVYAVIEYKGTRTYKIMNPEEVQGIKQFSQSKGSEYSPWQEKNDPELNMWKKTALKQCCKFLPQNSEIAQAVEKDTMDDLDKPKADTGGLKPLNTLE